MSSSTRRARGASLLEVMVALAIGAILLTSILGLILEGERVSQVVRARAELASAGTIANQMLRQDLSQAGMGMPKGFFVGTTTQRMYAVLVASPTSVGVLGDLARPDANFTTFGMLDDRVPAAGVGDRHITWRTENSGNCIPGGGCSTADTSIFFPGETGCTASTPGHRTCPWGLRRLRGNEPFQIVAANGQWFSASNNNAALQVNAVGPASDPNMLFVNIGSAPLFPVSWSNNSESSLPTSGQSQGWVTTLDRVFYRFDSGKLERIQCWGRPDITHTNWPPATVGTTPASPCTNFQGMSNWETIARNVESVEFTYFDGNNNPVTNIDTELEKRSVRRVEWRIILSRTVLTTKSQHEVVGGVFLSMAS